MRLLALATCAASAVLAIACDKPSKVVFDPEDDVTITSSAGADLPAVLVKTKGGKIAKGVTPSIAAAPEGIVSLDGGKLTPVKNGKATLTASAPGLKSAELDVLVDVVDNVKLNCPSPCAVAVGSRVMINASVHGLGGPVDKTLEWKSSRPEIAIVDSASATVTGVAAGTTTITATAGAKTASLDVVVLPALDELRLYCPSPPFVVVEKKNAPPPQNKPPQCVITQGGSVRLLLHGAKGPEVFTPPVTWQSSSTGSLLIIDGEVSARDLGFASVSAVVGDLKAEMPIQVVSGKAPERCTDPLAYGNETQVALASGTKSDFMCASPAAGECMKASAAEVDRAQAPAELLPTLVSHALEDYARRCCCKPK